MPPENNDSENSDQNVNTEQTNASDIKIENQENDSQTNDNSTDELSVEDKIKKGVDEALKPIKDNLDKAYQARDDALAKVKEFEDQRRQAEIKRLEEEGKHKEAYEAALADEKARNEALNKRNVELTRDIEVKSALSSYELRNQSAHEMVFKEVVANLVQDDKGNWLHKDGTTIEGAVKSFLESPDNSFLLKAKVSSGSGQETNISTPSDRPNKSLFEMPQSEVIRLAGEGKLQKN